MPLFLWKPSYELRIPEIDIEHRYLVGIINELYEKMKDGRGYELVDQLVDRLIEYAEKHFATEESFMRSSHYPGREEHEREHRRLREQLLEMERRRRDVGDLSTIELMTFLCDWLRAHITTIDKEFGRYYDKTCR